MVHDKTNYRVMGKQLGKTLTIQFVNQRYRARQCFMSVVLIVDNADGSAPC